MRIVFFFILTFATLFCNAQFTTVHTYSSQHTLETALGGLKVNRGFINTVYVDTATANLQPIKNYPAAQIWVNDTVYIRNITATKWIAIGAGGGGGGSGTVTNFSIVTANGFSGSVANSTTTPALTITTTITGLLKGNGTAISAAVAGTDYLTPTGSAAGLTSFPTLNQNTTGSAATLTTGRTIGITGDLVWTSPTFDGSANVTASSTLATVNSNTGSFGSSTSIPTFTVNAKGLITAASGNVVIAPAGTLTGTTLAANVVTSSLTSVGTISTGVWNATTIGVTKGGTGLTALGTANQLLRVNAGATALEYFTPSFVTGNIYTADGSLAGNRVVTLGSNSLTFSGSAGSTITYTADTHTFNLGGGTFNVVGGTAASGNAGNISLIAAGSNGVNDAGNVIITGGLKADGAGNGGDVIITSGGATVNDPGSIYLVGASATSQGKGGIVNLTGGNAVGASESGGDIVITGGNGGVGGQGGNLSLTAGTPGVGGPSGNVGIAASSANDTGDGGVMSFSSGSGGATSGNGGGMTFIAGTSLGGGGNGGDVLFRPGRKEGAGINGLLKIEDATSEKRAIFETSLITSTDKTFTFPDASGTFILTTGNPSLAGFGTGVVAVDNDGDLSWIATPSGGGLTIGTTTITSGTNTRVLFNNSGVVGEYVISGTGNVAMTTSPTFTTSALWAGSTSGTITIAADALSNVISGTVLSGTGTIPVDYDIVTRADETLANTTADQPIFTNTAHDVITILANTTYDFELRVDFTHGATAHNIEFGMIPTTATITSIEYNAYGWVTAVGTNTATQNSLRAKVTTTTQVIASGSNATETLDVRGTFTVGATGGSIMPTIQFSADPTGTVLLKTGARFKLTARGNETFTQKGPIN